MENEKTFDLLLVGHITKDRIITRDEETSSTGGAVYYGSFPASLFNDNVGVLTKLASRDHHILEEFHRAGIPVLPGESRETTTIQNIAKSADFERRRFVVDAVADPFSISDFGDIRSKVLMICPLMRGESSLELLKELDRRAEIGIDVQGFIRVKDGDTLRSSDWEDKEEGLSAVTYLKADKRETEILTGIDDVREATRVLSNLGPREILVTHQEGILLYAEGEYHSASFDAERIVGRTGRGDTAFATYLAKRFSSDPREALRWTAALVSRKLERQGPFKGPLELVEKNLSRPG